MPKIPTLKDNQRKDDDIASQLSYTSEILRKKNKIFGINPSTLNFTNIDFTKKSDNVNYRSLTLAPSIFNDKNGNSQRTQFFTRESEKYADLTKEKIAKVVNDEKYHKKNDLNKYTYNSLTGRYY